MNQNAMLCRSLDELLQKDGTVHSSELKALEQKVMMSIFLYILVFDLFLE